jgi:hypothetical protein
MNYIKLSFILLLTTLFMGSLQSQDRTALRAGFMIQEFAGDFGLGLQLDIPTAQHWPVIWLAGSWLWKEIPVNNDFGEARFQTVRLGLASKSFKVDDQIRVYGEGGVKAILLNDELSTESLELGGYGLFGFEFFVREYGGSAIFLEMGGSSVGNGIERKEGIPTLGSGFMMGAGFRLALN